MNMHDIFNKMASTTTNAIASEIKIDDVINSELGEAVDYHLWLEVVNLQKKFNDRVAPGWLSNDSKYDFWMAVMDEAVEVLGSRHWKWWKNSKNLGEVDWDNVKVELIDLFHFILSLGIQHELEHVLFTQLVNLEMNKDKLTANKENFFEDFWNEFLMAVQMRIIPVAAIKLIEFWYRTGEDAKSLFKNYLTKASLNEIRQEFGYSTGGYIKEWVDIETGEIVEDNAIVNKLAEKIEIDKNYRENLMQELRQYYMVNVAV